MEQEVAEAFSYAGFIGETAVDGDRFVEVPVGLVDAGKLEERRLVAGVEAGSLFNKACGFGSFALIEEGLADALCGFGRLGIDLEGLTVG